MPYNILFIICKFSKRKKDMQGKDLKMTIQEKRKQKRTRLAKKKDFTDEKKRSNI